MTNTLYFLLEIGYKIKKDGRNRPSKSRIDYPLQTLVS